MPTGSDRNGSGPTGSAPEISSGPAPEAGAVIKGGPFDLGEMERLANEMFRALPGVFLPGLDAEGPASGQSEPTPPRDGAVPMPNGRVANGARARPELSALSAGVADLVDEALDEGAPEWPPGVPDLGRSLGVLDVGRSLAGPARPPARASAGLFELTGDPVPLAALGLAALPLGTVEDPFAGSHYILEEAGQGAAVAQAAARSGPAPVRAPGDVRRGLDVHAVRSEFPILAEHVHGRPLVWLDNGATTQKPAAVIERLAHFYVHENSNIHRGAHELARRATDAYEEARDKVARFLHASSHDEVVFVRGATEAINLVAKSWGPANVGPGDEILITWLEHHANIVPWQQLCRVTGARLCVAPVDDSGQVMLDEYERLLSDRTRIVAFSHVSNALGTVLPAREMTELAHRYGARVLIDGAQAVSHMPVDVQSLDSDWYAFSGHKVFGPTGIGVLHGRADLMNSMPPWQGGGNMIRDVTFERTLYQPAPVRFEAGTANIADAVGLGAALDYVQGIGMENIARHEHELLTYATAALSEIPGLTLIGTSPDKAAIESFVLSGFTPEEVGEALNREGIAVRAGHHCAQPIVRRFGHEGTVRASLALYNTCEDIDALIAALRRIATRSVDLPSRRA